MIFLPYILSCLSLSPILSLLYFFSCNWFPFSCFSRWNRSNNRVGIRFHIYAGIRLVSLKPAQITPKPFSRRVCFAGLRTKKRAILLRTACNILKTPTEGFAKDSKTNLLNSTFMNFQVLKLLTSKF